MKTDKALLKVKGISKKFGGLWAIRDLDLYVEEGKIFGLIGPNGAGKSTLFNIVTGFCKPDRGKIIFQNEEITFLSPHQICRKGIARTFQISKPFEGLTVFKTLTIAALIRCDSVARAEEKAESLLHQLRLEEKRETLGRSLTVVERKRLELGRALATGPKLLLIDEVIAGLNPTEVDEISQIIKNLVRSGVTIFMIEHVMRAILTLTEKVFVLDAGEKIAEGDPKNLLKNPLVIEAYIGREDLNVEDKRN